MTAPPCCCIPRSLPLDLHIAAAFDAMIVRASNQPPIIAELADEPIPLPPLQIAMQRGRYWLPGQKLRVAFLDGDARTNERVLAYANRWQTPGIPIPLFVGVRRDEPSDVRVTYRRPGFWSYIGTDCRMVGPDEPTMCLQDFDSGQMPESEWLRVPPHEFGHTLAALHELQRPENVARLDPVKVTAWGRETQGWSAEMTYEQMLHVLDMSKVDATPVDVRSIMEYWVAAELTRDGVAIPGGSDITDWDRKGMALAYGGSAPGPPAPPPSVLPALTINGPAVSGPTPLKLAVTIPHKSRLILATDLTNAQRRAPVGFVGSKGSGEATPMMLTFSRRSGSYPWRRTDPWEAGEFVLTLTHPDAGKVGKASAKLITAKST